MRTEYPEAVKALTRQHFGMSPIEEEEEEVRASPHRNGWEESNGCVQVSVGVLNTRVRDGYVQLSNGGDRARERWIRAVEQRGGTA